MNKRDIIRWSLDWLIANDDAFTQELALRYEREARQEWGGQEVRVWRTATGRAGRPAKAPEAYHDALASTDDLETVAKRHGIGRRTIYGMLKRGPGR